MRPTRQGSHATGPHFAQGWSCTAELGTAPLIGANGVRLGPDGLLYVAQCIGSQISTVDLTTGAVQTMMPPDSAIRYPDDLVFDSRGALYATEVMTGRVSARLLATQCQPLWRNHSARNDHAIAAHNIHDPSAGGVGNEEAAMLRTARQGARDTQHHLGQQFVFLACHALARRAQDDGADSVENVWQYLRGNWLSHRVWESHEEIVDACCAAWNALMAMPDRITSTATRDWAPVKL